MRGALILVSLVALLAGACSSASEGAEAGPETPGTTDQQRADEAAVAVVRAWSAALNAGDNEAAGELFAPNAVVVQGPDAIPLPDAAAAALFTASLPCSGQIIEVRVDENVVTAVFELGDRETSPCDAQPGSLAAADFLIEDGAIVVWQQVPVPDESRRAGAV